jgi:hypothetical protein
MVEAFDVLNEGMVQVKHGINYKDASRVVNLKIKTIALNEPTRRFQNWLN